MARLRRVVLPGQPHLIIHRGRSGQSVFLDANDRVQYLAGLRASATESGVDIHAYALLPSEVRMLVTPGTAAALALLMQAVGRRYVRAFNQTHRHRGALWEGRFRSTVIDASTHFLACLRFVEASVPAACASALDVSVWSSLAHHLGLRPDSCITEHSNYWSLGNTPFEREAAYRRYVEQVPPIDETLAIMNAALNGWVLGTSEFAARVLDQTGRRPQPLTRGRPRKRADS
ncbi:MAG: transposase [Burkholderiales bacterium]|nr:transposase [Burkholderiales bacterium]